MPAFEVRRAFGNREARRLHEIHRDLRGDIGDRVTVASDKLSFGELSIEQLEEPCYARSVRVGPSRDLRDFELLHSRMSVTENRCHIREKIDLCPPISHFNDRAVFRTNPEQWGLRLYHLEVTTDRD